MSIRRTSGLCLLIATLAAGCAAPVRSGRGYQPESELDPSVVALFLQAELVLQEPIPTTRNDDRADRAAALIGEAIEIAPDAAVLYRFQAEAWASKPDFERAAAAARLAIKLDPTDAQAHLLLGTQLYRLGDLEPAETHLREAARRGVGGDAPNEPHENLFSLLRLQKRVDDAVAALEAWALALPEDTTPVVLRARYLWEEGRSTEARDAAVAALRLDPRSEGPRNILAEFYVNDPVGEAAALEEILESNWSSRLLHRRLVHVYEAMGRYDRALSHLRYVDLLERQGSSDLVRHRARLLAGMHRTDEAVAELEEAIAQEPTPAAIDLLALADVQVDAARWADALAVLARVPVDSELYWRSALARARVHLASGEPSLAAEAATAATQLLGREQSAERAQLLTVTFDAELERQDFDAARRLIDEVRPIAPSRATALRVRLLELSGDLDGAVRIQAGRVGDAPGDVTEVIRLAQLLVDSGELSAGLQVVGAGLLALDELRDSRLESATPSQRYGLTQAADADRAWLLLRRSFLEKDVGDTPASEASLREAMRLVPHHSDVLNALGYLLAEEGQRLDEATELVQQALDQRPWSGAYTDSLGWVRYRQGRFAEAIEALEQAARWMPGDPEILEHVADAWLGAGDAERAVQLYEEALEALDGSGSDAVAAERVHEKLRQLEAQVHRGR